MCFDTHSRPPIAPIAGGALDSGLVTLTASDGARFGAFQVRAAEPTGAGIVILPDVRGLHPYYEELALRFAERGIDALAIDYFGRTAGTGRRDPGFEFQAHVEQTRFETLTMDIEAAARHLRSEDASGTSSLFVVGFCYGGRLAFVTATLGLDLAGVIGFYGKPAGPGRAGVPEPTSVADRFACPVLGLFGEADPSITSADVAGFDAALTRANVDHRLVAYPGAPHSFFDRKADEFAEASAAAWDEVLAFIRARTSQPARA